MFWKFRCSLLIKKYHLDAVYVKINWYGGLIGTMNYLFNRCVKFSFTWWRIWPTPMWYWTWLPSDKYSIVCILVYSQQVYSDRDVTAPVVRYYDCRRRRQWTWHCRPLKQHYHEIILYEIIIIYNMYIYRYRMIPKHAHPHVMMNHLAICLFR